MKSGFKLPVRWESPKMKDAMSELFNFMYGEIKYADYIFKIICCSLKLIVFIFNVDP